MKLHDRATGPETFLERIRLLASAMDALPGVTASLAVGPPATGETIAEMVPEDFYEDPDGPRPFPEALLRWARVFDGLRFTWKSTARSKVGAATGGLRIATLAELQATKTCGIAEGELAWPWLPDVEDVHVVFVGEELQLYARGTGYVLTDLVDPVDLLNAALDRFCLSVWILSQVQHRQNLND